MSVTHLLAINILFGLCCVHAGEDGGIKLEDKSSSSSILLLLDVSASLQSHNRKYKVRAALTHWIQNYVPDGVTMSIVKFASTAKVLQNPTLVNSSSREELIQSLPIRSEGEACISCGIEKAIEVATPGTAIVIMTDGDFSDEGDIIKARELQQEDIQITTILLGNDGKDDLLEMGTSYLILDKEGIPGLLTILTKLSSPASPPAVLLEAELENVMKMTRTFQVDSTVSANVCLSISSWPNGVAGSIKLSRPDGKTNFLPLTKQLHHNCTYMMVGSWQMDIETESDTIFLAAEITAETDSSIRPIKFSCSINEAKSDGDPPSIHATLQQGSSPVTDATVIAELHFSDGSELNITLWDNGRGADFLAEDRVYSRYIPPQLQQEGWVSAYCRAKGNITIGEGPRLENFIRTTRSKMSKIPGDVYYAPMQITDLRVTQNESSLILEFTAPGSEMDWGQASEYWLLLANSTEGIHSVHPRLLSASPKPAGRMERLTIPIFPYQYLAMQALGGTGLISNISNIEEMHFSMKKNENEVNETEILKNETAYNSTNFRLDDDYHENQEDTSTLQEGFPIALLIILSALLILILTTVVVLALILRAKRVANYRVIPLNSERKKTLFH